MTVRTAYLEAKLREIEGVVIDVEDEVRSNTILFALAAGAVVLGLVALAVWRSRQPRIMVEVYAK